MLAEVKSIRCTVLMNCRNGEQFLKSSLNSLAAQTHTNFQVIFFDNNSRDNSVEIAESYRGKLEILIVRQDYDSSLYEARNNALKYVKTEFLFFLDVDDLWHPNKLEKQIEMFTRNPACSAICSNYHIVDENFLEYTRSGTDRPTEAWPDTPTHRVSRDELLFDYKVGLLSLGVRISLLKERSIPFDKRFHILGDFAMIWQLSKLGPIYFFEEPLAAYRIHQANEHIIKKDRYYDEFRIWINENVGDLSCREVTNLRHRLLRSQAFHQIVSGRRMSGLETLRELRRNGGGWVDLVMLFGLLVSPSFIILAVKKLNDRLS